jgi:hypothetical protein
MKKIILILLTLTTLTNAKAMCELNGKSTYYSLCSEYLISDKEVCFRGNTERAIITMEYISSNYHDEDNITDFKVISDDLIEFNYVPYAGETSIRSIIRCKE